MQAALSFAGVSHRYGSRAALEDVSFTVPPGRFAVLLGLNGAGKTTLFSVIAGLLGLQSGEIRVFAHSLKHERAAVLGLTGFVFQQPTLDLDLTVIENLRYAAALHGIPERDAAASITAELGRLGIEDRGRDRVRKLSGGQRRRVEIARGLLHRPRLMLLDEASVGLDLAARRAILNRVRGLCREEGMAALWATHLLDEATEEDQIIVLHRGRVVADGTQAEICAAADRPGLRAAFSALTGIAEPNQ